MSRITSIGLLTGALIWPAFAVSAATPESRRFEQAWQAARRGDRDTVRQLMPGLQSYVLYPYLQYDDLLSRRSTVSAAEMASFLESHQDWAFTEGLRRAWLKTLGQRGRWADLVKYGGEATDTEVRCHRANAQIKLKQTDALLSEVQDLWAVGKSQPDACDPAFDWLRSTGGITPELAWLRIRRAMESRNPRLTLYLSRFVPAHDRVWVERWQQQDRVGYTRLSGAKTWPDGEQSRDITDFGLSYLARKDADRAWNTFEALDGKFDWGEERRARILKDIALWSAVARAPDTPQRMRAVPADHRDDKLLEWWARHGLGTGEWSEVILSVAEMGDETRLSDRWRYWDARARLQMGDPDYANQLLDGLSREATYHGFLAADWLDRPYSICPAESRVSSEAVSEFRSSPRIQRVIELREVGLKSWSRSEWRKANASLDAAGLRVAAAFATEENWPDLAIFALASSGDLNWYELRFPVAFRELVEAQASRRQLDMAWVMGLMRSESAMAEDAISPANARGLLQVMPGTAKQIASRNSFKYHGTDQLMQAEHNILFGTTFLRELMDKFGQNPVLVAGAYNAGPGAVNRWLNTLPRGEAAIWIETLPYYETREYIPRVLAFSAIYDWRLGQPVRRLSARMPALPATGDPAATPAPTADRFTTVACPLASTAQAPGGDA